MTKTTSLVFILLIALAACSSGDDQQAFQATLPPEEQNAPVYTPTPTATYTPTLTPTHTLTFTPSPTFTSTPTITPTPTLSPTPTVELATLEPVSAAGAPPTYRHPTAEFATPEGWECGDFPCEDDIDGFLARIRVPEGYVLEHVGRYPGQPMQITYGPDNRLYATVLENGTRSGAVYALDSQGAAERYSDEFVSPVGLAFQPGTDTLYVSARITLEAGGGLWRVRADGTTEQVLDDLPCCFIMIDNQPNGMVFGPDGYLYLGVGALTDHAEPSNPSRQQYAEIHPQEAAILRIQPHTGEVETYARGIRNPYDLTFDSSGQMYATDNGLLEGLGDRLLQVDEDGHYGWPYWRTRGCRVCPVLDHTITVGDDLLRFPDYTLPRGLVAYTSQQLPENIFDSLFVTLWNEGRVIRIEPENVPTHPDALAIFEPEPFVTGLIRPVDVTVAPDGSLVVVDFIYGHVWRVRYVGGDTTTANNRAADEPPSPFVTATPRP